MQIPELNSIVCGTPTWQDITEVVVKLEEGRVVLQILEVAHARVVLWGPYLDQTTLNFSFPISRLLFWCIFY